MGHLAAFSGKGKEGHSKTFMAAGPVTVHICCVDSHVRMFVHVFVCSAIQLFYTRIPAHLAASLSLGSRGFVAIQQ